MSPVKIKKLDLDEIAEFLEIDIDQTDKVMRLIRGFNSPYQDDLMNTLNRIADIFNGTVELIYNEWNEIYAYMIVRDSIKELPDSIYFLLTIDGNEVAEWYISDYTSFITYVESKEQEELKFLTETSKEE